MQPGRPDRLIEREPDDDAALPIELLISVDSTSAEARRRVEAGGAPPRFALVADEQTAGRGRRGRRWVTLPGRSLALTLVLPDPGLARPARAALLAAVAAARACEALGSPELAIKWPNDLMREDRKAGGILVESAQGARGERRLLLGVGLNLALHGDDLPGLAAGDVGLPAHPATRDALARALVRELARVFAAQDDPSVGREYRRRSWLTGREVVLETPSGPRAVRVADVTAEGDLVLEGGERLRGEHVSLRPEPPGA